MSTPAENMTDAAGLQDRIARFQKAQEAIVSQVRRVIVGQEEVIDQVMVALFVGGHCLITGLPGTAKTLLVRTLAQALGLEFKRIQFTPDLMPSDITGYELLANRGVVAANRQLHPRVMAALEAIYAKFPPPTGIPTTPAS